jgi:hypothetical protein
VTSIEMGILVVLAAFRGRVSAAHNNLVCNPMGHVGRPLTVQLGHRYQVPVAPGEVGCAVTKAGARTDQLIARLRSC